ncbi:biopolymer transport exbD protein [Winogradskyella sp. PG-2]|nr:biopolymer transport exbD protein [Winogradskyella sp. PG-2]
MINDDIVELSEVEQLVKSFVENDGKSACDYCEGEQSSESSDHPKDAVISLSHDALTKYSLFIEVQNEISKAYYDLRARYTKLKFNKTPIALTKQELEVVKKVYPFIVSEVPVKRTND